MKKLTSRGLYSKTYGTLAQIPSYLPLVDESSRRVLSNFCRFVQISFVTHKLGTYALTFLVDAFLGKSARLLQWLVFFSSDHRPHRVCTTFYRLHSRSHVLVSTRFTVNPAVMGSSPCFSQKLFRAIFFGTVRLFQFFWHCATFFRNFFLSPKGPPSSFLIFCSKLKFQKAQRIPPF